MPQLIFHRQRISKLEHLSSKVNLTVKMRHTPYSKRCAAYKMTRKTILLLSFIIVTVNSYCQDTIRPYYGGRERMERYPVDTAMLIKNAWLSNGQQIIYDGNGYREYEMWGEIRRYYYRDGDANGLVLFMDTTKTRLNQIGYFIGDLKDGQWTTFHKNGQIASTIEYDSGQVVSDMKLFYENAKLKSTYPVNKKLEPIGSYIEYYASGKVKTKGQYDFVLCESKLDSNAFAFQESIGRIVPKSIPIGKWIEYYESGQIKKEFQFENNCTFTLKVDSTGNGSYTSWLVTNECPSGKWIEYDEKGKVIKTTVYKDCVIRKEK